MNTNTIGYPVVNLGKGLVTVGYGHRDKLPAIILSINVDGPSVIGSAIEPPGEVPDEEMLAVITFSNVESLDVFISIANGLRTKMIDSDIIPTPVHRKITVS